MSLTTLKIQCRGKRNKSTYKSKI